jgi:hypothetical protein
MVSPLMLTAEPFSKTFPALMPLPLLTRSR